MSVTSTQGFKFKLVADGVILDLFKDEQILLSDNVTGLFDLGILPSDFTRQITLPGSKRNNHFFEFVYDISVEDPYTFSTNRKVQCYLDFDGIYLSNGYLQLNKVNIYQNKFIDSYEVTVYGGLASFGRDLKRYFLTDLTSSLAQYNHTSSFGNIVSSWGGGLSSGSIVYPMAEYGQKLDYQTGNGGFGINNIEGAMCVQDWKPSIKMKTVFDACFNEFGYTYTSSFMEQSWVDNIYMVCNNKLRYPVYSTGSYGLTDFDIETYGQFKIGPISGSNMTNVTMSAATPLELPWYNLMYAGGGQMGTDLEYSLDFNSKLRGELNLNFTINNTGSGNGVPQFYLKIIDLNDGYSYSTPLTNYNNYMKEVQTYNAGQTRTETFELLTEFTTAQIIKKSDRLAFYLQYNNNGGSNFQVVLDPGSNTKSYLSITKVNQAGEGLILDVAANMPYGTAGIRLIDFITSVQKKFNLVIYPNKTKLNEFIIEPFNQWYKRGSIKDFNRYINLNDRISATPANNLAVQNLNFGDTLDGDYISQQFSKGANREFGKAYYVDTNNFFSQGTFEVKTTLASSPLIYLQGTGVSGSVGSGGVVAYPIGACRLSTSGNPASVCISDTFELYSSTGVLEAGAQLFFDPYGNNAVIGYRWVSNSPVDCEQFSLNTLNGVVIGSEGYCPECV
jgi:hypothetical protein